VATDDRDLGGLVRAQGAEVVSGAAFWQKVASSGAGFVERVPTEAVEWWNPSADSETRPSVFPMGRSGYRGVSDATGADEA